jgi:hypothetical protein
MENEGKIASAHLTKVCEEVKAWLHTFLTSALLGGVLVSFIPLPFSPCGIEFRTGLDTIPIPAIFGTLTLHFRESKCFIRGPETLVEMEERLQKEFLAI